MSTLILPQRLIPLQLRPNLKDCSQFYRLFMHQAKKLRGEFAPFEEISKYESLIEGNIPYANYEAVRKEVFCQRKDWLIWVLTESLVISIWFQKLIESPQGRLYLIDWEYSSMNDPMWDLAALFLESEFTKQEEDAFLSYYESDKTTCVT